jgi:sensor histidine kinase YesM
MNPHFMFNALNTIQEFILTNQQEVASEYLADFADLMRMYLNQSNEDNVSLAEEEETLRLYLRLENLRFNEDLDYSINIDPTLNKDGTFIPVMLLQPYVENSIKHGLLHKKGTKRLNIEFIKTPNNHLKCTITDNGIGRKASGKINSSKSIGHKSFATGANDHRVDLINQNRDKRIQVDIIDLYEDGIGSGTKVEIYIK